MTPTVGRIVHYYPVDQTNPDSPKPHAAIITAVESRLGDGTHEESAFAVWIQSFPPPPAQA